MSGEPAGLVVCLSNVGDAVMTTPVLEALHAHAPDETIDLVLDARSAELFAHCPYAGARFLRDKRAGLADSLAWLRRIRRRRYRFVVDLRTDLLAWLVRAERRVTRRGARGAGGHAVERHMAVVRALLGNHAPIPDTRVWLTPGLLADARARLRVLAGRRCLALGPGANWPGKIWPARAFADLAGALADEFDAVVLLGGSTDAPVTALVAERLEQPCLDLAGETTLLEAAAVLSEVDAFVGNDSGLGHVAAAVGTPTLTVFGPGEPERYHPWGPRAAWIRGEGGGIETLGGAVVAERLRAHLAALAPGGA